MEMISKKTLIPHVGTLSIIERAQIANWIEAHISQNKKVRITWLGFLPIAHAHTLFIAYRLTKDPKFKTQNELDILQKAWEAQLTSVPTILKEVDVDWECLASLEEEMFENTDQTGPSGNWQWGLDAGYHQGGWDPSFGVPASWDGKERVGDESEREVRSWPVSAETYPAHSDVMSSSDLITSTFRSQSRLALRVQFKTKEPIQSHVQKIGRETWSSLGSRVKRRCQKTTRNFHCYNATT